MASRKLVKIKDVWTTYLKHLNGVFCIYKPVEFSSRLSLQILQDRLVKDLNKLPMFKHEKLAQIHPLQKHAIREAPETKLLFSSVQADRQETKLLLDSVQEQFVPDASSSVHSHNVVPFSSSDGATSLAEKNKDPSDDYFRLRLVVGNVFKLMDIELSYTSHLSKNSSGVIVVGVGREGKALIRDIQAANYLAVYHVKGRLGFSTQTFFHDGVFVQRRTFNHVTKGKLDRVCGAAQSGHQRRMFECAGVDRDSQEAYELACAGIIRPSSKESPPVLYGVKCIYFNPPEFTLEVHSINADCKFLAELVHDIGKEVKSAAVCTHIHKLRHGHFTLDDALLYRDWHLQPILTNMQSCRRHITFDKLCTNFSVSADNQNDLNMGETKLIKDNESPSAREILEFYKSAKQRFEARKLQYIEMDRAASSFSRNDSDLVKNTGGSETDSVKENVLEAKGV
ncbi:pseudouridylate synthase TRUB2, mitochondrial-like [Dreissena polymorpha]|uniref:Pseudouridine synthase II N-terminal domain-containing protein n=1 Tax=Dreissena polymorpha TaxID=45954 RepID=A0A9D4J2V9_DREPO|nr:pseudouridylate synthase TRUB2, mitochondrial-like [Dreissena polymorpha]XP_052221211.1 pseudouridylate synthase TRUB2, mitochondrial-like [Dreissena polymorpha]XP_052221212.1 pseudouridylate synthase TRUB2, mitochondrial-like [Dreissena polymorpha]KAH3797766.1 hypothetical protein DPMN_151352 [Dreissena polymorpha]